MSAAPTRARMPFVAAVLLCLLAGLVAAGIGINAVAGKDSPPGVPAPAASPAATP